MTSFDLHEFFFLSYPFVVCAITLVLDGVDLGGFTAWSLMDIYQWTSMDQDFWAFLREPLRPKPCLKSLNLYIIIFPALAFGPEPEPWSWTTVFHNPLINSNKCPVTTYENMAFTSGPILALHVDPLSPHDAEVSLYATFATLKTRFCPPFRVQIMHIWVADTD